MSDNLFLDNDRAALQLNYHVEQSLLDQLCCFTLDDSACIPDTDTLDALIAEENAAKLEKQQQRNARRLQRRTVRRRVTNPALAAADTAPHAAERRPQPHTGSAPDTAPDTASAEDPAVLTRPAAPRRRTAVQYARDTALDGSRIRHQDDDQEAVLNRNVTSGRTVQRTPGNQRRPVRRPFRPGNPAILFAILRAVIPLAAGIGALYFVVSNIDSIKALFVQWAAFWIVSFFVVFGFGRHHLQANHIAACATIFSVILMLLVYNVLGIGTAVSSIVNGILPLAILLIAIMLLLGLFTRRR